MQSVGWVTFGVSSAISRSIIHFFPSAQITSAPYPVVFRLKVFGKDIQPKTVSLEGGRLGQPDGVRLEDAFPHLAEGVSGLIGLQVEITTSQPRIDLSPSQCVIEIVSSAQSVRFTPRQLSTSDKRLSISDVKRSPHAVAGIHDAFFLGSIAVVNAGDAPVNPQLVSSRPNSATMECVEINFEAVAPNTVHEINFHEGMFTDIEPQECSWGLLRGRVFEAIGQLPDSAQCYAIYRDTLTKRIISVTQI